nr:hypothetical protein LSAT_5X110740 [Ipomoea trifida]
MLSQKRYWEESVHVGRRAMQSGPASSNPVPQHPSPVSTKPATCMDIGITLEATVVNSSNPDPPDAKLTPVRSSYSDKYGCRNGGTLSLRPSTDAIKSGTSFPSENLPVGMCPGKRCPYGG